MTEFNLFEHLETMDELEFFEIEATISYGRACMLEDYINGEGDKEDICTCDECVVNYLARLNGQEGLI